MNRFPLLNSKLQAVLLVIIGALLLQPAAAQQAAPNSGAAMSPLQKAFMQKRNELQQLQSQLGNIQKKTMDKHPELQKKQSDFRDLMISKMKDKGHDPNKDIDHLKSLQAKLQDKDIKPDQRKALIKDFRQTNMTLRMEQQKALQDSDVQKARQSLSNDIISAMRDEDPRTDDLLKKVKETRQSLIQMQRRAAAQAKGQPSANTPGGF